MEELTQVRISIGIHFIAGVLMGWVAFMLSGTYGDLYAILLSLAVLLGIGYLTERILERKGVKWWISNGVFIYLFFWIISWVFFFNMV